MKMTCSRRYMKMMNMMILMYIFIEYLWVSSNLMSTVCELIYLILIIALRTGWYYYPHISCEEVKGKKGNKLSIAVQLLSSEPEICILST